MRHSDYFMMKQIEILKEHHLEVAIRQSVQTEGRWFRCYMTKKGQPHLKWDGRGKTKAQALSAALVEYAISMGS